MPARLRTTYRHSQAGGSPRPLFFLNRIYQLCILLLLLFLSFLHFCIAFRRLPITDSSNKEHPVGGYGHKSTHSNCPTRSDRRSSHWNWSCCYLETFAGAGCPFAVGVAAYLASSELRAPPCPLQPRAHRSTCTSSCSKSAAARWPGMGMITNHIFHISSYVSSYVSSNIKYHHSCHHAARVQRHSGLKWEFLTHC